MNLYDLLEDYFVDSEDAVRTLITWFKNQVMEVEAFPNEESLLRLAVSILIDINEE